MATIALKGNPIHTIGSLPSLGSHVPDFQLTGPDLSESSLSQFGNKIKILNIVPSLDTGTCSASAKKFNDLLKKRNDVVMINISMDLPFAQDRFCKAEHLDTEVFLSAFRSSFPKDFGILIVDGPLKGLCSRAVILLDKDNKVLYTEQVPEITQEPNYEAVLKQL
ncbi:MAG: thiol peroxidase [Candidatus Protochlamydia sp.]|nr:thiol peroxidase [Candidatus Protochlamydia sp.]